jgi:FlaG/FlaF family flagellin (archaellin)
VGAYKIMKVKRKFITADEHAISAVIGVILMVAITVAMAAVAYAYYTGMIGGQNTPAPSIEFRINDDQDRLEIVSADAGANWNDLQISANKGDASGAVYFRLNNEIAVVGDGTQLLADTNTEITGSSFILHAGDFIDLEGWSTGASATQEINNVVITIIHTPTNTLLSTYTFIRIVGI